MTIPVFNSVDRLIRNAMEDAGQLEDGSDPTPDQQGRFIQRLNDIVNVWQTQGLKLFLLQDISVPLVQGQTLYTFGPSGTTVMTRPLEVIDAYYSSSTGIRRPLLPMARFDWDRLSTITSQGAVNQYFVDKQALQMTIYIWNPPDATAAQGTFHPILRTQAGNYTTINDTILFPIEWWMALRWALASEICAGQPDSIVARCEKQALYYKTILEDWDVENAPTQFQPDPQGGYGRSRFA